MQRINDKAEANAQGIETAEQARQAFLEREITFAVYEQIKSGITAEEQDRKNKQAAAAERAMLCGASDLM